MMAPLYYTRAELEADIASIREMPHIKALEAERVAQRLAMMERRAKYSPEELERLDRETMLKLEAWLRGDVL